MLLFDKLFKIKYVEVPPCPRCNSHKTGFYLYSVDGTVSNILIQKKYLKSGQRVRVTNYSTSETGKNVFCESCGIEWMARLTTRYVSKDELNLLMSDKGVSIEDINKMYHKGEGTDIFGKKKKKPLLARAAGTVLRSVQKRAGDDGDDSYDDDDEDDIYGSVTENISKDMGSEEIINEAKDDSSVDMMDDTIDSKKYRRYKVVNNSED